MVIAKEEIEEEKTQQEKARVNQEFKKNLAEKIKTANYKDKTNPSINIDTDTPLLSGDYSEEVRQ